MPTAQVQFFLGNTFLGEATVPWQPSKRRGAPPTLAYLCPTCGSVWARTISSADSRFTPKLRHCEDHGSGLFHEGVSDPRLKYYPRRVLERELRLLAKHLEGIQDFDITDYYKLVYSWSTP